jgi:hypothetical protein
VTPRIGETMARDGKRHTPTRHWRVVYDPCLPVWTGSDQEWLEPVRTSIGPTLVVLDDQPGMPATRLRLIEVSLTRAKLAHCKVIFVVVDEPDEYVQLDLRHAYADTVKRDG